MATAESASTDALVDALQKVDGKAEIVNGEIVRMSPTGRRQGRVSLIISVSLMQMESQLGGCAYADNVGFLVNLPHRRSFSPDAAFCLGEKPDNDDLSFAKKAPDFAVKIRSENDYGPTAEKAMAQKRADYFAAGTKVVWDVDLLSEDVVRVYRADKPTEPTCYRKGDQAEAEPAVPGWAMPVDQLFE